MRSTVPFSPEPLPRRPHGAGSRRAHIASQRIERAKSKLLSMLLNVVVRDDLYAAVLDAEEDYEIARRREAR